MPSPRDRLQNLIDSHVPSEVVFRPSHKNKQEEVLVFETVITKGRTWIGGESDSELKVALLSEIQEVFDSDTNKFIIDTSVDHLWLKIKRTVANEYERVTKRCTATMRKTSTFIENVYVDDKYLPNFFIQVFLTINSPTYKNKSRAELEELFEQFEPLRRTYGKRS